MSTAIKAYYTDSNFLNTFYSTDLAIIDHFASMLFGDDQTRVEYASNTYALRHRSNKNNGLLNLPFLNFKIIDGDAGDRELWNAEMYTKGVYIPSLAQKVICAPITYTYEATFWCHTDFDMRYAYNQFHFDSDNQTDLTATVEINSTEIPIHIGFIYSNIELDPEYNEQDWLERNKVHSISLSFEAHTFALQSNTSIYIPERVLFNFYNVHQDEDVDSDLDDLTVNEAYDFLISELDES